MKNIRNSLIWIYIAFTLTLSIGYAATTGELEIDFIAYIAMIQEQEDEYKFEFYPMPDQHGNYFTALNLPSGLAIGSQSWTDEVFHLTIYKIGNMNGNQQFSMNFNFVNPSNYPWARVVQGTNGIVIDQIYTSGGANNAMFTPNGLPAITAPATVAANSTSAATFAFSGKVDQSTVDAIQFHVTYTFTPPGHAPITGTFTFRLEFRAANQPPYTGWPMV